MYNFTVILNAADKKPLYEQLYEYVANQIRENKFSENERMPSKKSLAAHLGISVNTVETAYEILVQEGYLRAVPRSGFYVRHVDTPANDNTITVEDELPKKQNYKIDFCTNAVDIASFPYSTWVKLSKEVMYKNPELLNAGEARGEYELRKNIVKYLHEFRGVDCSPKQVIIGAGIEYLLMLLIELLGKNRKYAIENPGYGKVEQIFTNSGCDVNYIDLDNCGISVSELQKTNSNTVYITPSHQFPLGIIMPFDRRRELLGWVRKDDCRYIIEDDYNSEFNFSKRPITALQGMNSEKVIYLNTFSRILAPSIRIAYMVLPKKLVALYEERFSRYSSTVLRFEQHTLSRFISDDYLSRHLNRVKNIYRKRRDALMEALQSSGIDMKISGEKAGLHLLLTSRYSNDILNTAEKYGIKLYNSDDYYFTPQGKTHNTLILGYAGAELKDIEYLKQILALI